ncbi:uncharacterized protein LOC142171644 [Nicotiana tabacum]|uniref:Uncharacterized protein LOC142171644 n=1 Tax=Nicotiana tabacum TaxID=4097 RepID=A0AC58T205_TOBAC
MGFLLSWRGVRGFWLALKTTKIVAGMPDLLLLLQVGLVGEENMPFPEKWNFAPTMGTVEEIPDLRGWVEKLLTVAPMEERSWKYLSNRFGWKVKTHGFSIRGVGAASITTSRLSLSKAHR